MIRNRRTWVLLAVSAALFAFLNLAARPGVGPRMPPRPPGSELERYFGWPATYRAELWESDDPGLALVDKGVYRTYAPPANMNPVSRESGPAAAAVDLLFVAALLVMTGVAGEAMGRKDWSRREVAALAACLAVLAATFVMASSVSVSL